MSMDDLRRITQHMFGDEGLDARDWELRQEEKPKCMLDEVTKFQVKNPPPQTKIIEQFEAMFLVSDEDEEIYKRRVLAMFEEDK